jgi:hypothetical protein
VEPPRRVETVWPNPWLPPSPPIEKLAFDSFDPDLTYGVVAGTFFRRSAAAEWGAYVTSGCIVTALATSPVLPGHVRLGFRPDAVPSECDMLLDSSDSGLSFTPPPSPLPRGTDGTVEALAFDPRDPNVWYVAILVFSSPAGPTGHLVFATTDGGLSWRNLDWPGALSVRALALDGDRQTLYAVSDTGVFAREIQFPRGVPRAIPFRR